MHGNKNHANTKVAKVSKGGRVNKYTNTTSRDNNGQDESLHDFS